MALEELGERLGKSIGQALAGEKDTSPSLVRQIGPWPWEVGAPTPGEFSRRQVPDEKQDLQHGRTKPETMVRAFGRSLCREEWKEGNPHYTGSHNIMGGN